MAKMIKNLSVANIKKIEGMVRREDLDFSDDGNRFRGFAYKGMPITTLRSDDTTYLCIRVDYLNTEFTYKEWMKTNEYHLCDEFNGVSEFDVEKLIENLEKVIVKVDEMNAKAAAEEIDMSDVENRVAYEIEMAEEVVENFKKNYKWYEANEYELRNLVRYLKSLEEMIKRAKSRDFSSMSKYEKRRKNEMLNSYGYVEIKENDFYIRELTEAINK